MSTQQLPVIVVGAGPAGLAAATHLIERGVEPLVLEAGDKAGAAVREWSHVRLFSTWGEVVDPAAEKLLVPTGWARPDPATYPFGGDWAEQYLQPLADTLGDKVRTSATVTGVSRAGRDRIVDAGREQQPFVVHVEYADGREERILARAVIDASGTWATAGPAGGSGLPALGEKAAAGRINYRVPDLKNPAIRARYAGKRTAVIGSGASAFTALAYLAELAESEDGTGTHAVWILRRGISSSTFGGGTADQLPARGALGLAAKAAVDKGHADAVTGFRTEAFERDADGRLVLVGEDGRRLEPVDEVIVLTGFRPDLSFLSEIRLNLDERLQAPVELAPLIDPNQHSCGTVYPHGHRELSHPEQGVYLVGMKSYGRAPTFLAMTGYEQVRSVAAAIAGDLDSADRVELTLPETGVCGGAGLFDTPDAQQTDGGGCCAAPEPQLVQLAAPAAVGAASEDPSAGGCYGS
ncbi:NAD(P)-binding domain-containing protein [Streptomyces olivaceus]|uniref:NAD(P)-binding domain-containing protein n=1 Tax=Streptomyces olivaceus TaxID=47716 RepID=A0ABS7VVA7_STROV|nr:NAD(P)-binding domain-containing protein [Streptomyces olivaceus]MBZ6086783.1 NAD(P)-binding domain-containing protein [Streptomyces olivaceus]MBZ6094616.1 NAD(P)-binding domain-containing protein [Streptomyces olivaceus]MBZ6115732.1 NAD(P)-binding domain-containing protein [Streptomyces olivaceus]MBZ6149627.1 NAD(P)-binding domain-containing protein [Streptomyces olivaceus]MBZ6198176.1 NAD(P)-binding domain-containing protein [Streptomyces olivaceus]